MSPQEVEDKIIELKHREPFAPFIVDLNDGHSLEIHQPGLAIAGGGATFLDAEGVLADFEFDAVRAIRLLNAAEVA
jgi:hypothetical protein